MEKMEERIAYDNCPLCESEDFSLIHVGDCSKHDLYNKKLSPTIEWMKCRNCQHVFTAGYFTEEACEVLFSKTHEFQKVGHDIENARLVSARMIERVLPFVNSGQWLDVGFGNGSLLFTAKEFGFEPIGVDLRMNNVLIMNKLGIRSFCEDLANVELENECSVISIMNALEHVPYPRILLAAVSRLLKKGGVFFVSTPNSENVIWDLMTKDEVNPYWGEIEHYHNFSRTRLYKLLTEFGFEPVRYAVGERYRVCMEIVSIKNV